MASDDLVALAVAVRKALASSAITATKDEAGKRAQKDLLNSLPDLQRALESPKETLLRVSWSSLDLVLLHAVNRFQIAQNVPLDRTISYRELSGCVGLPESQLRRLLRYSMTQRMFHEPEVNQVAHTPISHLIATHPLMQSWIQLHTEMIWPVAVHAVEAFEKWPGSSSPKETPVSIWKDSKTTWFEQVAASRGGWAHFREAMEMASTGEGWSTDILAEHYPWESFGKGTVVDIGGANGHASIPIAKSFPALDFIVQDLEMSEDLMKEHRKLIPEPLNSRITFMQHDFFEEQPVKNADVYFFRCTMHNWADEFAIKILRALIPALKPGARIVIQDNGLASPGTIGLSDETHQRIMDIMSLCLTNSKEREEEEWKLLFEQADSRFKWLGAKLPEGSRLWIIDAVWVP
ncbi:hypothetical protein B7494_g6337 [Chlorociboria aeruginascens]|nr:hypothetical protein B7494_g6337 [Chlorociboria aeruginascens]